MKRDAYSDAGVDVRHGERFAKFIAGIGSPAVSPSIGSFAGGVPLPVAGYRHPVVLGTTDGVGTKLLVARRLGDYSTVGIDLVAMCVNDLAVCGATPLLFLDYIACGTLIDKTLSEIIAGVVRGCELATCTLSGGETAELPGMYAADDVDLAGFAVGIVEADERLPQTATIQPGDVVLGIASSGIHSNGFSLARTALRDTTDDGLWRALLTPTRIYVDEMRDLRPTVKAAAHITGGGLEANLLRVLPEGLSVDIRWNWTVPEIFLEVQTAGNLSRTDMRSVFNMGIGVALVVAPERETEVSDVIGERLIHVGEVTVG